VRLDHGCRARLGYFTLHCQLVRSVLQLVVRLRSVSVSTSCVEVTESSAVVVVGVAAQPEPMFDGFVLEYQKKSVV